MTDSADVVIDVSGSGDTAVSGSGDTAVDSSDSAAVVDLAGRRIGPVDLLDRVHLFDLDLVSAQSVEVISQSLLDGAVDPGDRRPMVLTPNVDILVHLARNTDSPEADAFRHAQYCLPDGQPLVWASRMLGRPLDARLPGSGLFTDLWPRLIAERRPTVVVASSKEVANGLGEEYPEARFVVPPMFDADDAEAIGDIVAQVTELCRVSPVEFVLLGIGNPKDSRIARPLIDGWPPELGPPPMVLGLGASFRMYLGHTRRAPEWVQRIGMEWFHRFLQEPRRLFNRYFVRDVAFLGILWREFRAGRR